MPLRHDTIDEVMDLLQRLNYHEAATVCERYRQTVIEQMGEIARLENLVDSSNPVHGDKFVISVLTEHGHPSHVLGTFNGEADARQFNVERTNPLIGVVVPLHE